MNTLWYHQRIYYCSDFVCAVEDQCCTCICQRAESPCWQNWAPHTEQRWLCQQGQRPWGPTRPETGLLWRVSTFCQYPCAWRHRCHWTQIEQRSIITWTHPLSRKRIIELLSFCLNATYFLYRGNIYKQKHGAAMSSPVSPIKANLYMEEFEAKAIHTAPNPPSVWLRYVDDTFVKIHEYFVNEFMEHLNNIDENIKFTTEPEMEGKLPFLDSCTTLNDDGSLDLTVYRKPTHTDQYLNFDSNRHLQHKRFVVQTLINRANCMVTKPEQKGAEVRHVKSALKGNGYKEWAFKIPHPKTSPTPIVTPQGARPAPAWAYLISEVHP